LAGAKQSGAIICDPTLRIGRLLALSLNIRLGWKSVALSNTLAYYSLIRTTLNSRPELTKVELYNEG
jgi:hypothetical protein